MFWDSQRKLYQHWSLILKEGNDIDESVIMPSNQLNTPGLAALMMLSVS